MEASSSRILEYDYEERRILEGLIDAFSSTFSLREIASAFCKSGRNPDLAAEILYDSQGNTSNAPTLCVSENETGGASSSEPLSASIGNKSGHANKNSKASKPKKLSVSTGSVSGILGKGYAKPKSSAKEPLGATKPLKVDMKELPIDELLKEDASSDCPVNDQMHKDIEDFLFKMLGNGFQLDMDVIRDVLGCCGYDAKKSMDRLMDLSASKLKNSEDIVAISTEKCADEYPKPKSILSHEKSEDTDLPQSRDKERYDLQKEVLVSLFGAPERLEEVPKKTRIARAVQPRRGRQVVTEPPKETEHFNGFMEPQEESEDEEENENYKVLRRATMEHWITMKEYFKSAFDAFANGDRSLADELLEQGQIFNQKAREADEKSSKLILQSRKENQDVTVVDLHADDKVETIRKMKLFLSNLSGIPCHYLKFIIDDASNTKKGSQRNRVQKFLEKESIKWTEEGNQGTILIQLDEIDPMKLSFYGEKSSDDE